MSPENIYDKLLDMNILEPAVLKLGNRFVIGRFEKINDIEENSKTILPSKKHAIVVLGEGKNWTEAFDLASERIRNTRPVTLPSNTRKLSDKPISIILQGAI